MMYPLTQVMQLPNCFPGQEQDWLLIEANYPVAQDEQLEVCNE